MTPLQQLIRTLLDGDSSMVIDLPVEPSNSLQASFLTVALNIVAQTDRAIAVMVEGELAHCALYAPAGGLVLDATGIRSTTSFDAVWMKRSAGKAVLRVVTIAELTELCPPESGFFARALSSFEKVVVKHFIATAIPAIVGFQIVNRNAEHWGDRPSFEILPQDLAHHELVMSRRAQPDSGWSMVTILEGDIEKPIFANA